MSAAQRCMRGVCAALMLFAGFAATAYPLAALDAAIDLTARVDQDGRVDVEWYPPRELADEIDYYALYWSLDDRTGRMALEDTQLDPAVVDRAFPDGLSPESEATFYVEALGFGGEIVGHTPTEQLSFGSSSEPSVLLTPLLPSILNVTIRDFEATQFPTLFSSVQVDSAGGSHAIDLPLEAFDVYENGVLQTECLDALRTGSGLLDFVFLIDHSGSMEHEIQQVVDNVGVFAQGLEDLGYDVDFGYVRFGYEPDPSNPFVLNSGNLYDTTADLLVDLTPDVYGGYEPGCQAVLDAQDQIHFRPGALRQFLIVTDEDSDAGDCDGAADICNVNSTSVHAAYDTTDSWQELDYGQLARETGGLEFYVDDPYDSLFTFIAERIKNFYRVRWCTSDSTLCLEREVDISVSAWGETDSDTTAYTPGGVPEIERTQETIDFSIVSQVAGLPLNICASMTDCAAPFIQDAELYYRTSSSGDPYTVIAMTDLGGGIYCGEIPGIDVVTPGIDYYLRASDGVVVTTDPSNDPQNQPYQIAVWPNEAPVITHSPIECAPADQEILVSASIYDSTFAVAGASIFYREGSTFAYSETPLTGVGGSLYEGYIPADVVVDPEGVDYYLSAIDDLGVGSTHGTADSPHHIGICDSIPVCVQVAVGPQNQTGNPLVPYEWEIPVLTSSDLTQYDGIYAFEIDIRFDPTYFNLSRVSRDGGMATHGYFDWDFIGNPADGLVRAVWAGASELVNAADSRFVTLIGTATQGAPCMESSSIEIDTLLFNEGSPCSDWANGSFEIPGLLFSGTVNYFSCDTLHSNPPNPRPIPGLEIEFAQACSTSIVDTVLVTEADGSFGVLGCSYCSDCLTPMADQVLSSPAVTEYDAWMILDYLVEQNDIDQCMIDATEYDPTGLGGGLPVVCDPPAGIPSEAVTYGVSPPFRLMPQRIAADCSENGSIQAYDASLILMYAVNDSIGMASAAGTWDFYCESRCYLPEIEYPDFISDVDFTGIMRGDVSGDWPALAPLDEGQPPMTVALRSIPAVHQVDIYLSTPADEGLFCGHVDLRYPADGYAVSGVELLGDRSSFLTATKSEPGGLQMAFAGIESLAPATDYVHIRLDVLDGRAFSADDLSFALRINDNSRAVSVLTN